MINLRTVRLVRPRKSRKIGLHIELTQPQLGVRLSFALGLAQRIK